MNGFHQAAPVQMLSSFTPQNPFAPQKIYEESSFHNSHTPQIPTHSIVPARPVHAFRPPTRQRSRSEGDFFFLPKYSSTLEQAPSGPYGGITGSMIVSNDSLPPLHTPGGHQANQSGGLESFLGETEAGNWVGGGDGRFFEEPEEVGVDEDIYKIVSGLRSRDSDPLPPPRSSISYSNEDVRSYLPLPRMKEASKSKPKPKSKSKLQDQDFEDEQEEAEGDYDSEYSEENSDAPSASASTSKKRKIASPPTEKTPKVRGRPREPDFIPTIIPGEVSRTTKATRLAAEARRISEPRFVCYCGESFTRKYNLNGEFMLLLK